jgi:hypothetical protein
MSDYLSLLRWLYENGISIQYFRISIIGWSHYWHGCMYLYPQSLASVVRLWIVEGNSGWSQVITDVLSQHEQLGKQWAEQVVSHCNPHSLSWTLWHASCQSFVTMFLYCPTSVKHIGGWVPQMAEWISICMLKFSGCCQMSMASFAKQPM